VGAVHERRRTEHPWPKPDRKSSEGGQGNENEQPMTASETHGTTKADLGAPSPVTGRGARAPPGCRVVPRAGPLYRRPPVRCRVHIYIFSHVPSDVKLISTFFFTSNSFEQLRDARPAEAGGAWRQGIRIADRASREATPRIRQPLRRP
jgi:hypothetical protein